MAALLWRGKSMIISVNPTPTMAEFALLMKRTDQLLTNDAAKRPKYYVTRNGSPLEDDVKAALDECAIGTPFENTIEKISGQKFPDIVAAKLYGVEVKSTKENHWTSTGSSILESSRVADVERIFMTFGKLGGNPIAFRSRPYEECLSGIAVTHMPRYLIDMRLNQGETIFDKMGVPYDTLRKMDNPIAPVSRYYRSKLKNGEKLWWAGEADDEAAPATLRLWDCVPCEEKRKYTVYGLINFPEIFGGDYGRYALWLVTSQSVVDTHIRDQFSAGGREPMLLSDGTVVKLPGIYRRIKENSDFFIKRMFLEDSGDFLGTNTISDKDAYFEKVQNWIEKASRYANVDYALSVDALKTLLLL